MSPKWCPGSITLRHPTPKLFKCSNCGVEVEIWSDEAMHPCPSCGKDVFKLGGGQSCIEWCRMAKECIGEEKYKQYGEMRAVLRKQALINAMEDYFQDDAGRIEHAKKVTHYAEMILSEENADPNVVLAAAVLHDIGIKNAERKHKSSAAAYQELEGPPVAREILTKLGYEESFINEVCDIVGHHHHPREEESNNFKALYDADLLVNIEAGDAAMTSHSGRLPRFYTKAAARLAEKKAVS